MGLKSYLKSFLEEKSNPVWKIVTLGQVGQPKWTEANYEKLAQESYEKNDIAYSSVEIFARNFSQVEFKLFQKRGNQKEEIREHELLSLLNNPNPQQGKGEFLESLVAYRLLSGNPYIHANVGDSPDSQNFNGKPEELWLLRPDRMKIVPGKVGIMRYEYDANGRVQKFPADQVSGKSNILHWKTFHPTDDYYGLSPVQAGGRNIDIYNEGQKWNMNFFVNGTRPSGALIYAPKEGSGKLTQDEFERLKDQMDEQYSGTLNNGRPLLLEGGMDWKSMSMSPKDIDFLNGKNVSSRDIARIFGVPPLLLNIPGDNTYSNQKEAKLGLWEESIIPWVKSYFSQLNYWLVPRYGDNLILEADFENVTALEPRRSEKWERAKSSDFLTINEKRNLTGFEDIDGGDELLIPSSLVPISFNEFVSTSEGKAKAINDALHKHMPYKLTSKATDEDLRREQLIQERLMVTFERSFEQKLFRLLDDSAKQYAEAYKKAEGNIDIDSLVFGDISGYTKVIADQYDVVYESFGKRIQGGLKSMHNPVETKDADGILELGKVEFVGTFTVDRVEKILQTTKNILSKTIEKGVDEGLSVAEISVNIYKNTGEEISRSRARTIARTETHTAAQAGSHQGALSTGLKINRIWAHADDGGVRDSHIKAQEESKKNPVAMDQVFKVGNTHLKYPGDPTGLPEEIINCRCVIIFEPIGG